MHALDLVSGSDGLDLALPHPESPPSDALMVINDRYRPGANLWLTGDDSDPEILVIGVPFSRASVPPSSADLTPGAVRQRLSRFSTYHGERGIDFGSVAVSDRGNWPVSELDILQMPVTVESLAKELPDCPLTVYLGGDNAVTRPLVRAAHEDLSKVGVITFGAHHDGGTLDLDPVNGASIRGLIDEDGLSGENVSQIGIHSFTSSAQYARYCDEVGIQVLTVSEFEAKGAAAVVSEALDGLGTRCEVIYVNVGVDVLDQAFAPGCQGARPGGLTVRQLADAVFVCAGHEAVRWMDFVEVDAAADRDGLTVDALAHLILTAATGFASRG